MALTERRRKAAAGDAECLKAGVRALAPALMELAVAQPVGAARYARALTRSGPRHGDRDRDWDTRVGTSERQVPRVRDGRCFPSRLAPRQRAARAQVAGVQEAYVPGVSTRRVDARVQALGMTGISKRPVSRRCQALDGAGERFRTRRLDGPYPAVWLAAPCVKGRDQGRGVALAGVVASGVRASGERAGRGRAGGPREDGAFWRPFLRGLVARGRCGGQLVIRAAPQGLNGASAAVLQGAGWPRCRVPFVRNALALVPKPAAQRVAATIRTGCVPPAAPAARAPWRRVAASFRRRCPRLATWLDAAEADGLASLAFPPEQGRQIWSNTPLERLNQEIKRRTDGGAVSRTPRPAGGWSARCWPSHLPSGR